MSVDARTFADEWAPGLPVPTKTDFVVAENDLDGQHAWRQFGGLSRSEAYEHFLQLPHVYQEDFMFMGTAAFAYYYPVIERYLLEMKPANEPGDHEAWILAQGIKIQWSRDTSGYLRPLAPRMLALARFVSSRLEPFSDDKERGEQIAAAWAEIEQLLAP